MTYHVLANRDIFDKLSQELKEAIPDPQNLPHWATLEKLPYLNSVVQESLRLSYGASGRSPRIATQEDLVYKGEWQGKSVQYVIPRGYAIGMSPYVSHHDENLFPESHKFKPERWLDLEHRKELERGFLGEWLTNQDTGNGYGLTEQTSFFKGKQNLSWHEVSMVQQPYPSDIWTSPVADA